MPNDGVPMWAFSAAMILLNGILGLMMMRLWKSVDDNTESVNALAVDLPTTYETKRSAEQHHQEDQQAFDAIRNRVHALDLRVTAIDGDVKVAQAGMRDAR